MCVSLFIFYCSSVFLTIRSDVFLVVESWCEIIEVKIESLVTFFQNVKQLVWSYVKEALKL